MHKFRGSKLIMINILSFDFSSCTDAADAVLTDDRQGEGWKRLRSVCVRVSVSRVHYLPSFLTFRLQRVPLVLSLLSSFPCFLLPFLPPSLPPFLLPSVPLFHPPLRFTSARRNGSGTFEGENMSGKHVCLICTSTLLGPQSRFGDKLLEL